MENNDKTLWKMMESDGSNDGNMWNIILRETWRNYEDIQGTLENDMENLGKYMEAWGNVEKS